MPFVIPPLVKWAIAALGGAAAVHWAIREIRRVNEELDRVRAATPVEVAARKSMPTLRRDPATGEWHVN
jgi:precorrin-4 methylase